MGLITEYLLKFKKFDFNNKRCTLAVMESVAKVTGADLTDFHVERVGGNNFIIRCSPSLKNLIVIKKREIRNLIKSAIKNTTNSQISIK